MRLLAYSLLGVLACGAELAAFGLVFIVYVPLWALILHSFAVVCAAVTGGCVIRRFMPAKALRISLYLGVWLWVFPGVGLLGALVALLPPLFFSRPKQAQYWQVYAEPGLPQKPVLVNTNAIYSRGGLISVLQFQGIEGRVRALMASQKLNIRKALPILQAGLSDSADEVRLLAYSIIDRKQYETDANIQHTLALANAAKSKSARAARLQQLAALYSEMSELQLGQGLSQVFTLKKALLAIEDAIVIQPTRGRLYAKGQVLLNLKQPNKAKQIFKQAEKFGMNRAKTAPYLAECAFMDFDVEGVQQSLTSIKHRAAGSPTIRQMLDFWL